MNNVLVSLRTRLSTLSSTATDALMSVCLFMFLISQFLFTGGFDKHRPPHAPEPNSLAHSLPIDSIAHVPYIRIVLAVSLLASVCLALVFRRRAPWPVLIFTTIGAALYTVLPFNPTFVVIAPLLAIYTVALSSAKNTRLVIAFIGTALGLCLFALTYGTARWTIELVGFTALLAVAALFGNVRRSDLAYLHEAEQRALEAERSREQEAQTRVEIERVAIAREVHDIIAHSISIIAIQSAAADTLIDTQPEAAHEAVANIRKTSKRALAELRGMINVLRNDASNNAPLTPVAALPALDEVVTRVEQAGIKVDMNNQTNSLLPAPVSISAYRIVQEALTNILRHSNADEVRIDLIQLPNELKISVADNGTYTPCNINAEGHGLQGMRERCEVLGGTLETTPLTGAPEATLHGFKIAAVLPFSNAQESAR